MGAAACPCAGARRHVQCLELGYGGGNVSSVYFATWFAAMSTLLDTASNHLLSRSSAADWKMRRLILWIRSGTLPNGALAFKYALRPDDSCALCGQPDGRMHAISGCRAVRGAVINRHHAVERVLVTAIAAGAFGGDLVMADVGSRARCDADACLCLLPRLPRDPFGAPVAAAPPGPLTPR